MLAYQIINLRKKAGMSQLQLAKMLHIGPSAISMYEQRRRTPSIETLIEMSKIFQVSLDYLITGKESTYSITGKGIVAMKTAYQYRTCCCCHKNEFACNKHLVEDIP